MKRMKKIFGVLSLIAILTVTFVTNASANSGIDKNVEFVVNVDYPSIDVAVSTVEVPNLIEFNVVGESTNYIASVEGLTESVPIVSVVLINGIVNINIVASVEGLTESVQNVNGVLNDKLVSNDNVASVEGLIKVFSLSDNNSNETNYSKIFLPFEVGLTKETLLI